MFAWEQCKLGDVCEEVSGNNGNVKGLPILTISAANGWMNQKDRFSQVIAGNELKKYTLLEKGHLAYNHGNSKLAKYGTAFVQNLYDQALVPRVYHSFKMKTENNPYYVEYYFATKKLDRELARLVTSGARMDGLLNINKKDFFKIKFEVPTPVEQSLISTILQKLDQTITLHEEKKRQLECLKSALLQKMFADENGYPAVRFRGFDEAWKQCKLGDVGQTYTGLSGKSKEDFGHGKARFVTYMNIYSNPVSDLNMVEPIEIDERQNEVQYGDAFFTTSSETPEEVGMASVWTGDEKHTYLNSFCFGYRPISKINPYYLAYMLNSQSLRRKIVILAQGISRYNISKKSVMEIPASLPSAEEQNRIGLIFKDLDQSITLYEHKLELLKRLKSSLLQNMFI
ncbi:restriction endonuclease subunit S [Lactobacillus delbrueckii subsp. bulgaricus]|nr:restriction endonuclease subunit S [Lactobacillus delbrueckii subsp. bulgaricus]MBT9030030.1 restriction endonuclease subunit S [Lactobacillus delbrueckii subsp. bulgaricus]